jgi:hypothetical protein
VLNTAPGKELFNRVSERRFQMRVGGKQTGDEDGPRKSFQAISE